MASTEHTCVRKALLDPASKTGNKIMLIFEGKGKVDGDKAKKGVVVVFDDAHRHSTYVTIIHEKKYNVLWEAAVRYDSSCTLKTADKSCSFTPTLVSDPLVFAFKSTTDMNRFDLAVSTAISTARNEKEATERKLKQEAAAAKAALAEAQTPPSPTLPLEAQTPVHSAHGEDCTRLSSSEMQHRLSSSDVANRPPSPGSPDLSRPRSSSNSSDNSPVGRARAGSTGTTALAQRARAGSTATPPASPLATSRTSSGLAAKQTLPSAKYEAGAEGDVDKASEYMSMSLQDLRKELDRLHIGYAATHGKKELVGRLISQVHTAGL
eukprot:comp189404_c0_seq1/m.49650 comp189404_c0_seq1/g.49650  ORF comp189404_c0_seq1/g.49650 comp189404_c0_seq1/m.49650 type:complete len:322 (-) comp189404_c0_seq1:289-1254(-)